MFYRRKVILALLEVFGGELDRMHLQKLLFLFSQKQEKPEYDFVPYKFGCYSFSANADMVTMVRSGLLSETDTKFIKNDPESYVLQLKKNDLAVLEFVKSEFGSMDMGSLKRYTYQKYPYYAIQSQVAETTLSYNDLQKVKEAKPNFSGTILFTIGYEGISLEEYLNRLLKNDVKLLVDVRKNALSMKYGFSKSQLLKYCGYLGIEYVHIPEVGIESDKRQELSVQEDYDRLFENYSKSLSSIKDFQLKILELLKTKKRIALTCFEADINRCHRKHLAEAIKNLPGFEYEVRHI
ncbi:MAG: DUF488 domain-containing protein [Candidatus Delongbacteria bacterium]|jgi:hypothetical protein|nr:DUF488 domain-containing protein [Candidatus Delongbacteria bacterium]